MTEDDDGKTVFQPSKRKNIQKGDVRKAASLKQDGGQIEPVEKGFEDTPVEKKATQIDPTKTKEAPTKEVKPKKAMQFDVGDVLSNVYKIKRFIAKGGMGEVYEAVNVHNPDERVAIKVMLPEFAADERVIAMFAKEAGTLTRLHHEAIVPYRLSSRDELGRPFIVTAYVDGPSLEDQFKAFAPSEEELGRLTRRLAEGLGKAHSFGAIHRDIAPDNVLLVDGNPGLPKIIDFGIAQDARAENKGATIIGDGFAGKLNYVAPEQLGEYGRNIGPWTDLYSLALTMLAVATQKHADMGGSIASAVKKRMTVPDISAIPPRFRRAFKAALQPDPADRPQTMETFIKLMDKPAETEKLSSFAPLNSDAAPEAEAAAYKISGAPNVAGKGKLIGAVVGAVLLMGAASAFIMMRGSIYDMPVKTAEPVEAPSAPVETTPPPQETQVTTALVESATASPECSWLAHDNKSDLTNFDPATDSLRILGGAGNVSQARQVITRDLSQRLGQSVRLDISEVVSFSPGLCDAVRVIKDMQNPTSLISTLESSHIFEVEMHRVSDGEGGFVRLPFAKTSVEVSNIAPSKFITILSVDPRGLLVPVANGREQIQWFVDQYGGDMKQDGFSLTLPTTLEGEDKEGYGFVVITGNGNFPQDFFSDTGKKAEFPLTQNWLNKFTALARANSWTSDVYWFSVVDEVDD